MSKLTTFEIIRPEIIDDGEGLAILRIEDVASTGELIDLSICGVKFEGKIIAATITIETEED